ncbi:uncharacterized protein N7515_001690 [Penicillium bovifimosum]|uniref:Uncharacterized protein n=1 Tax=Penicillium bovifimosum TaxID=126998 RepID=A0A9W9HAF3_9EURO|nr:uncharacterized protein N7515_001690 [Penicillium bovifimosum]KAJ5142903.1 hypothetical protein N7515_001690 [Penicillium bovifimosum]
MVYYVRFLKTPKVQQQKGSFAISALICITTDLGDSFLAEDVDLMVRASGKSSRIAFERPTKWQASNRELAITLGPLPPVLAQQPLVLTVQVQHPQDYIPPRGPTIPLVVAATSAPFGPRPTPAEKLILRRIQYSSGDTRPMEIWEETGNSIARHIWDAGLATVTYIHKTVNSRGKTASKESNNGTCSQMPALKQVLSTSRNTPLQVVELGAGCGIVGIALAQMLPNCSVLLTDLPEVGEIITRNINAAQPATMSSLRYQNLDWDDPPENLCSQPIDLILVSDCTYNSDSLPALVSALDRLVRTSPEAIILVALKRRHDSETVFFELMESAGFAADKDNLLIPSQHGEDDEIEFYCYSRSVKD